MAISRHTSNFFRRCLCVIAVALLLMQCIGVRGDARLAEAHYQNVEVLRGLTVRSFDERMQAFNRALGVGCDHCHVVDAWHDDSKPALATARAMIRMVVELNDDHLAEFEAITCWTCHAGQKRPARMPGAAIDAEERRWPADLVVDEGVRITMCVYDAALGVGCDHCHVIGDWRSNAKPALATTRKMVAMFDVFPRHMPAGAKTQCFLCHKGSTKPIR